MAAFDELKVLATARQFALLSRTYESTARDLYCEWSTGREITKAESEWLQILHDYSKTLDFYSKSAEAVVFGWDGVEF
ncbi:hypothetical protein SAMN05880582_101659 [Rhizobium sp. RU20A]|uniref:hypothetical protein n=1 Tax=Rhizobium sp. RU20A TaxID=1907412 RepID=UPI0009541079|nr:hypothetical protein [Rhizobium sp. RU20A]SIQ08278.1 hypothetical protein SAMN05880582_101659 [Rhizobium sp. RU20A]